MKINWTEKAIKSFELNIVYIVHPRKKEIDILLFWDNRQNPDNKIIK